MAALKPIKDAHGKECKKPMRTYQIFIDGIDKTGKDLIRSYIFYLGKGRYICVARGIMSMQVYSKIYDRKYEYDIEPQKNVMNVLLEVDKEDWEVRCKASNEQLTDYEAETSEFEKAYENLKSKGCNVLKFNTSLNTPYCIAMAILNEMERINGQD